MADGGNWISDTIVQIKISYKHQLSVTKAEDNRVVEEINTING